MEQLSRLYLTREEMLKRVARFKDLKGSDGGLPDSKMPGCERTLFNVIGFQPPLDVGENATSPVGDHAALMAAIKIREGFNLGYCKAKPGHGPEMHNHDTNETFIAMTGKWRCEWNEGEAMESVDLDPYDVISFPTGVARRFMNVTYDEPNREHLLMFIIGGNQPQAEFTPEAMGRCEAFATEPQGRRTSPAGASRLPARATKARGAPARSARPRRRARRAGR
jgi:mannose-6-phosphate isomerase-like protein (cupin superfamily)